MAANIISIPPINQPNSQLELEDISLITTVELTSSFNPSLDIIEGFTYNINNQLIQSFTPNFNIRNTNVQDNGVTEIILNPINDLEDNNLSTGIYNVNYSFLRNKLNSSNNNPFYIKEISSDRTELRIDNNEFSNEDLFNAYNEFNIEFDSSPVFNGFYLNFGDNNLVLAVNIEYDNTQPRNSILIKLYTPLPDDFTIKSQFSIIEQVSTPAAYQIEFIDEEVNFNDKQFIKGPNFDLPIKDKVNNSTTFKTLDSLSSSSLNPLNYQLSNFISQKASTSGSQVDIELDYSDFSNFIHFSSAKTRLENFYLKAKQIEEYNIDLTNLNSLNSSSLINNNKKAIESQIQDIISNFDRYDYYLYFESSSTSWPKTTSTKPYTLASTGSSDVLNWLGSTNESSPYYGGMLLSASFYDNDNQNELFETFPTFIKEDPNNTQGKLFTQLIGQFFDEFYIYIKNIQNKNDGNNSSIEGISKDLVADAIKSFGVQIYESSFTTSDLFTSVLGINPEGETLPPTGSEFINTYVTSSSETTPFDDAQKLIYKRIYHNLPYLLKKKGTVEGLRILLKCFGVPDTILQITEFGGKNKINQNNWDYFEDTFNYAFYTSGSGYVDIPWTSSNTYFNTVGADTIQFRFKTEKISNNTPQNQLLLLNRTGSDNNSTQFAIVLEYEGPGLTSGSYSGSYFYPNYQYGTLKFIHPEIGSSSSISLPFYNNDWWSVMLTKQGSSPYNYILYAKNKIYDNYEGNKIGFEGKNSINGTADWNKTGNVLLAGSGSLNLLGKTYNPFSGSFQEFRYYSTVISESVFDDYVMNPQSFEGNSTLTGSSYNTLFFRTSLGSELDINSTQSIHPSVTGSSPISSFSNGLSNFTINGNYTFKNNFETFFYDEPNIGLLNRVTNKIHSYNNTIPGDNVLSGLRSLEQEYFESSSYSKNNNLLEVAFSPQNEIDKDIIGQLGFFNLSELIGDPRQTRNLTYTDLKVYRDEYFKKYIKSYNYKDYIRLIKYFDNALFKMVKDFTPARTRLSTGVVIKPTILERPKYPVPSTTFESLTYSGSIKVQSKNYETGSLVSPTGDNGGLFSGKISNFTQSISTVLGNVDVIHNDNKEFYNGELANSNITVTTQSLNHCDFTTKQIFSTSSITLDGNNITEYYIPSSLLKADKTYYFSFTINANAGNSYSGKVYINQRTPLRNLYTSDNISAGSSVNVENLQIINPLNPLVFFIAEALDPLDTFIFDISNFTINEVSIEEDCLPLINNSIENKKSSKYQQVDFTYNQIIPSNFEALISGSGTKFPVPDSNYTTKRITNPRYDGSKNSGQINYSQSLSTSSIVPGYPIDNFTNYFAYFDWISGANPQYPGGGNTHITKLINAETKEIITLSEQNNNIGVISQIYKAGNPVYLVPFSASVNGPALFSNIIEGGAFYDTILITTGSQQPTILSSTFEGISQGFDLYFNTSSLSILNDSGSEATTGFSWIYSLSNPSSSAGTIEYFSFPDYKGVQLFNKNTGQYIGSGSSDWRINYTDTYLPLQYGDFIRFGTTGSGDTTSLDESFNAGGLFQISSILTGSDNFNLTSSLTISPVISQYSFTQNTALTSRDTQNMRIFRRIPNETFVLTNTIPYRGQGLLIPYNFNPKYSAIDIANELNIN